MSNELRQNKPEQPKLPEKRKSFLELEIERWIEKLEDPLFLPSHQALASHLSDVYFNLDTHMKYGLEWNRWASFVNGHNKMTASIQEILTREYINALSDFLAEQVILLGGSREKPVIILEVGAGAGRLSFFLEQEIGKRIPDRFKIIATDIGVWRRQNRTQFAIFPVELIDYRTALEKHKPDIVICSWMPPGEDWTADFRKSSSVESYILIGEPNTNADGLEWETWGLNYDGKHNKEEPPYKKDGFERQDLDRLKSLQISRLNIMEGQNTSSTTIFQKLSK